MAAVTTAAQAQTSTVTMVQTVTIDTSSIANEAGYYYFQLSPVVAGNSDPNFYLEVNLSDITYGNGVPPDLGNYLTSLSPNPKLAYNPYYYNPTNGGFGNTLSFSYSVDDSGYFPAGDPAYDFTLGFMDSTGNPIPTNDPDGLDLLVDVNIAPGMTTTSEPSIIQTQYQLLTGPVAPTPEVSTAATLGMTLLAGVAGLALAGRKRRVAAR